MGSLTSTQIRNHIFDGVVVYDDQGRESLKPLIGVYDEAGKLVPTPNATFIEGGSFDLRLDTMYELTPTISKIVNPGQANSMNLIPAVIGVSKRRTPETKECQEFSLDDGSRGCAVIPGHYYLMKTVEVVNLPNTIRAYACKKTTTFRCGLSLDSSFVHPNYQGQLTFGLSNASPIATFIEKGARIASIVFWYLAGEELDLYEGVWQNGRVSTEMKEERGF